ncbi:MAG: hypothetical protein OSA93_13205 [Akkermansiaceae bacterium]|nr:hypothetical protein [Akkermansiaceae bacterium]
MLGLSGAVWLPFLGAALHPLLGWCVQRGSTGGVRLGAIVGIANLITAIVFIAYLRPEFDLRLVRKDWWAVGNGLLFFLGQWFSIQSVKSGDLAVHSSALGIKVVIVAFFSMLVGLEMSSFGLVVGVVLAVLAVFLVAGGSIEGWRIHRQTVGLTLVACLFFGTNDFLTGWQAQSVGTGRWMCLMIGTSGLVSLGFVFRRRESFVLMKKEPILGIVVIGAGLALGLQSLLVNIAFSEYQQPTLSNVVYSSRGVMAVLFLMLIGKKANRQFRGRQAGGAVLMVVALIIVLL